MIPNDNSKIFAARTILTFESGSMISEAAAESILWARKEARQVMMEFNDTRVLVGGQNTIEEIVKAWNTQRDIISR